MTFTTNGYTLAPFYNDDTSPYHVYFHRHEPEIVFGTQDSGVPNRQQSDGLTFLDLVWAKAPFAGQGAFVRTVATTADAWVSAGLLTSAEKDSVVAAAARADLPA